MLKYGVPLAVFAALVGVLYLGLQRDPRVVPSPLVGKPAPEFTLPRIGAPGEQLARADLLGKVSLLNVWASWCAACRDEHPLLLRVAGDEVLPIYGLNYKDEPADAIRWLDHFGDPYAASGSDRNGRVGLDLGVYGVPETFLIDRNGDIRYKHIGPISAEAWRDTILPLVRELQKAPG